MLKSERQDSIVELVNEEGTITVRSISERLGVSVMTVRRDLEELSEVRRLLRVHGGARSVADFQGVMVPRELTNTEKSQINIDAKEQVAEHAAGLVEDGATVFLGAGTTIEALARRIVNRPIRVVTNSLNVFQIISETRGHDPYLVGGNYRMATGAFVGPMAERMVDLIGIDQAFVGVNGIHDGLASTSNAAEGNLQRLALDRADERYLACDSSKVGKRDFFGFYELSRIEAVVTDGLLSKEQRAKLEKYAKVLPEA